MLPALISDWRKEFGEPRLPFLIFQISAYRKPQTNANEVSGMALLREAQFKTAQSVSNTALIVTLDLGEEDVHYINKEPAAERASKAALALVYERKMVASGPSVRSVEFAHDKATLHFDQTGSGLTASDGTLSGFTLAGADRKFVFAGARIEGDCVVVSSERVTSPVAVRYGWADFPKASLFNREGFPASPFRTDNWPTR
jgi:sialate O-acetylesterase